MSTSEIKKTLIEVIKKTNNPNLLEEMGRLIGITFDAGSEINLTQEQVDELELAIKELESGGFISHEEAKKQSAEWLKD